MIETDPELSKLIKLLDKTQKQVSGLKTAGSGYKLNESLHSGIEVCNLVSEELCNIVETQEMPHLKQVIQKLSGIYNQVTLMILKHTLRFYDQKSILIAQKNAINLQLQQQIQQQKESQTFRARPRAYSNHLQKPEQQQNSQIEATLTPQKNSAELNIETSQPGSQINSRRNSLTVQPKSPQDSTKTVIAFHKTSEPLPSKQENNSGAPSSRKEETENRITFSVDDKPRPLNFNLDFANGLRNPTQTPFIQASQPSNSNQTPDESKRGYLPSHTNLDTQTNEEDEEIAQELEEIMKSKQLIEQIKASGSDAALKQVLRNFRESKSNGRNLKLLEDQIMSKDPDDVDLDDFRDELLGVYDRTQKKTATRVLRFADDRDRRAKELLRLQVKKNSKGTEPDYELLAKEKAELLKTKDEEYEKLFYTLEQKAADWRRRYEDGQEKIDKALAETFKLKKKEAHSEFEKTNLLNEIRRLKTENSSLADKTHAIEQKAEDLKDQIKEIDANLQGGSDMITNLVSKINDLNDENRIMKSQVKLIEHDRDALLLKVKKYEDDHIKDEKFESESALKLETLKEENVELGLRIEKLESENKYLHSLLEEIKAQNIMNQNKKEVNEVKNVATEVKNETTEVKNEATEVKEEATEVTKEATIVKKEATVVKKEATAVKNEASVVKKEAIGVKNDSESPPQTNLKAHEEVEKASKKVNGQKTEKNVAEEKNKTQSQRVNGEPTMTHINDSIKKKGSEVSKEQAHIEFLLERNTPRRGGSHASLDQFQNPQLEIAKTISKKGTRKTSLNSSREFGNDHEASKLPLKNDSQAQALENNFLKDNNIHAREVAGSKSIATLKETLVLSPLLINKNGNMNSRRSSGKDMKSPLFDASKEKSSGPVYIDKQVQTDPEINPIGPLQGVNGRSRNPNLSVITTNTRPSPRPDVLSTEPKDFEYRSPSNPILTTSEGPETFSSNKLKSKMNLESRQRVLSLDHSARKNRISFEYPQFKTEEESQRTSARAGFTRLMISPRYSYQSLTHHTIYERQSFKEKSLTSEKPSGTLKSILSEPSINRLGELDQRRDLTGQVNSIKIDEPSQQMTSEEIKKQLHEQELIVMYCSMVENLRVSPDIKKIFKHIARERTNETDKPFDEKDFEVDYDLFKEYYTRLQNIHKKCGADCPHLKRFYQKIGCHPQNANRTSLHLSITDIDKLPRIIRKVYFKANWKNQYSISPSETGKF